MLELSKWMPEPSTTSIVNDTQCCRAQFRVEELKSLPANPVRARELAELTEAIRLYRTIRLRICCRDHSRFVQPD